MIKMSQLKRIVRVVPVVFLLACFAGCVVGSVQMDKTLTGELIEKIEPGKTAKGQILDWFGPPDVLARTGKTIKVPSTDPKNPGLQEMDSELLFELFTVKHQIGDHHIVYYYADSEASVGGAFLLVAMAASTTMRQDRLWILINQNTGIVEDYVFREGK